MGKIRNTMRVVFMVLFLAGCGKGNADITIMDDLLQNPKNSVDANEIYLEYDNTLEKWQAAHPDITVEVRKYYNVAELSSLALIGPEHMPDVFVADCLTGHVLAQGGVLLGITMFDGAAEEFIYNDVVYALPVLKESFSVVVYDSYYPNEAPFTSSMTTALSNIMADESGQSWLRHMIVGDKKAAFTDSFFTERLSLAQNIVKNSAVQDFLDEKTHAVLLSGDEVYCVLEKLKEENPRRYINLAFKTYMDGYVPCGYNYGLFFNVKLAEDSEKLAQCLDLYEELSAKKIIVSDETMEQMLVVLSEAEPAPMWEQRFSNTFWATAKFDSDVDKKIVSKLQDSYEQNYLGIEDFSEKMY